MPIQKQNDRKQKVREATLLVGQQKHLEGLGHCGSQSSKYLKKFKKK